MDENNEQLQEFLAWEKSSRDVIDVKRIYVDLTDDLVSGILLSQIVYWFLPAKDGKSRLTVTRDGKNWIAKSREDWWDECRISAKQFDRAAAVLEKKEFIITRLYHFNGSPVKHVSLNLQKVYEGVKSILPKGQNRNTPKVNMDIPQRDKCYMEAETTTETTAEIEPQDLFGNKDQNQKELKRKTKVKNPDGFELPPWMPVEPWEAWIEQRAKSKSPVSDKAKKMAVNKIKQMWDSHQGTPIEILEQTVINGWKGFWPVKGDNTNGRGSKDTERINRNRAILARNLQAGSGEDTGHDVPALPDGVY